MKNKIDLIFKLAQVKALAGSEVEEVQKEPEDSYLAITQLENIMLNCQELLELLKSKDDLPSWADKSLTTADKEIEDIIKFVKDNKFSQD